MVNAKEMDIILEKLTFIENRIGRIEDRLENITKSTKNMDNHISFVEKIYDSIKLPFLNLFSKKIAKKQELYLT